MIQIPVRTQKGCVQSLGVLMQCSALSVFLFSDAVVLFSWAFNQHICIIFISSLYWSIFLKFPFLQERNLIPDKQFHRDQDQNNKDSKSMCYFITHTLNFDLHRRSKAKISPGICLHLHTYTSAHTSSIKMHPSSSCHRAAGQKSAGSITSNVLCSR